MVNPFAADRGRIDPVVTGCEKARFTNVYFAYERHYLNN